MLAPSKSSLCFAACFGVVSVLFYKYSDRSQETSGGDVGYSYERNVIAAWQKLISPPKKQFQKLAVGVNSNIDIIVPGVDLLKALDIQPGDRKNHDSLGSLKQLQETFAYYFSKGSAAERAFLEGPVFQTIIKAAQRLNKVEHFIGGNAALMAKKASSLFPDLNIHFVGPVGPLLESLMPQKLKIPESCRIPQDEVHLIMEYKVGEKWGDSAAPVANRFITSYDESNAKVIMLEPFFESLSTFKPDLIILSGLQIMDSQDPEFFRERLGKVVALLQQVPTSVPVHLELASMANREFVQLILDKVTRNVNSLGLNEQEMMFSSQAAGGPHQDHHDNQGQPEIFKISDIMLWMLQTYGRSAKNPTARLTRIHFHSLTYHIVAVVESEWSNVVQATAAGAQIAGLQACDVSELNQGLVDLKIPHRFKLYTGDEERSFDPKNPVISWKLDGYFFVFSPVLVCKHPVKTVGLGDAISATGLMFSHFLS